MKRLVRTIVALGVAAAVVPLGPARAQDPVSCNGVPENPDAYVCIVRFVIGVQPYVFDHVDPQTYGTSDQTVTVDSQTVSQPDQTVTVNSQTIGVPAKSVHIPQVCAILDGFCLGPFDPSTPGVTLTTPEVSKTIPGTTVTTPEVSKTIPGTSVTTPGVTSPVPLIGVRIPPGSIIVLWYKGKCYYVYPNGTTTEYDSPSKSGCP